MAKRKPKIVESANDPLSTPPANPPARLPAPAIVAVAGGAKAPSSVQILELFILPPNSIARLGGSAIPLESYFWSEDPTIPGRAQTVIEPDVSFEVVSD